MFTVFVDENGAYMDETARRTAGVFKTAEAAKNACRAIVERSLEEQFKPGTTSAALIHAYRLTGEDPFIVSSTGATVKFSAWDYAAARASEICSAATPSASPG